MQTELEQLLKIIENKLDWGNSSSWQSKDFEKLNQLIFESTSVSLSASTLRRLWGRVEYKHLPSAVTLDTIAMFAGYENWRHFQKQSAAPREAVNLNDISVSKIEKQQKRFLWATPFLFAIIVIVFIFARTEHGPINPSNYSFSSRPVTRQIPNSVIFTYDAVAAPGDSVYIQQSWDPSTKALVDKNMHQHTSIYYEPGFYHAKLIVGNEVIKEHSLMIPSDGWLGLIGQRMVPVYLQRDDYLYKDSLSLPVSVIQQHNVSMEPMPPVVKYYNVGNFEPVPVSDFSFSADIKNEYKHGAGACQFATILLITDSAPIMFSLSDKGCVSDLNLRVIDDVISGKKNDLSGFGVDFTDWVSVNCKNVAGKIQFFVNNKMTFEHPLPSSDTKIVGFLFVFEGTGAIKNLNLSNEKSVVFHSF
ncbi:MAG: hypothetical protein QM764_09415 [Chitinophagaceae bacterium]